MTINVFLLILFTAPVSAEARSTVLQSYRFFYPASPGNIQLTKPAQALPAERQIRIQNRVGPDMFHYGTLEYSVRGEDGVRRESLKGEDRLAEIKKLGRKSFAEQCGSTMQGLNYGQLFVDGFLHGLPQSQASQFALNEMADRGYLKKEQVSEFYSSDEAIRDYSSIDFSSSSWVSAKELNSLFPESEIPWSRIAEVRSTEAKDQKELEARIKASDPQTHILLRRASVRLVSSRALSEGGGPAIVDHALPWESEPLFREQALARHNETNQEPLSFEIGRTSQLPGMEGEAFQLLQLTALAAFERTLSFPVLPMGSIPATHVGMYLHSLKAANTRLYKSRLKAEVKAEFKTEGDGAYHALLRLPLSDLLTEVKAWKADPQLTSLLETMFGVKEGYHWQEIGAAITMRIGYRYALRKTLEPKLGAQQLFPEGGMIRRNMRKDQALKELLLRYPEGGRPPLAARRDLFDQMNDGELDGVRDSWVKDGAEGLREIQDLPFDITWSRFDEQKAESDPNYLLKLLLVFKSTMNSEYFGIVKNRNVLIFNNPALRQQAAHLGLVPLNISETSQVVFSFNSNDLSRIALDNPELWSQAQTSASLNPFNTEIFSSSYRRWLWTHHPGL